MLDRSYYQLRRYLAANFKCVLGFPTIKIVLEALDACNFIAAYQEIGKMTSAKVQNTIVENMVVQNDPVMEIKLRACKCVLALTESSQEIMDYAIRKNLDFSCCSRSSYGNCLIGLLANMMPSHYDNTILEKMIELSKAIYRTDYNTENMKEKFPEAFYFMKNYIEELKEEENRNCVFLERVQKDVTILENEWLF